ncbi:MAG: hypothetical protein LBG87_04005 [Spirochaetaceae bacterium]|nr:hypothetical protein [Spirochaetaceae bacterium]
MYPLLFESLALRRMIPNRFTAQAMEGNDGENGGKPSARTINRYRELARGMWGLAVVEAVSITEMSLARINGLIINEKNLDAFKRLTEAFKTENPRGILLFQLTHAGSQSGAFSDRTAVTQDAEGCRYLSGDELERIKDAFITAALLAESAGADGVDFKMCHGYLGGALLRPGNTRPDKWGGSFENRVRLLRETAGESRNRLKPDFIIGSRISLYEGVRGGCGVSAPDELVEDLSEMLDVIRLMDDLGMDYVNVSAGIPALTGAITRPAEPSKHLALHHLRYTRTVKETLQRENRSLRVIGSAYSAHKDKAPEIMAEMLAKGYTDLCGFGRQTFADPLTPRKLADGTLDKINWCTLCSGCAKLMTSQINDGCVVYNEYYKTLLKQLHSG